MTWLQTRSARAFDFASPSHDAIEIEDITSAFHRVLMDWVDVRDFGAIGDGSTDDSAAFEAAEAEGQGVAVVGGKIVENLHVEAARRLIAEAEAIERLEADAS